MVNGISPGCGHVPVGHQVKLGVQVPGDNAFHRIGIVRCRLPFAWRDRPRLRPQLRQLLADAEQSAARKPGALQRMIVRVGVWSYNGLQQGIEPRRS